ncbi:MAG: carboxylate--amine ligase [Chloroflexota bacterium]
MSRTSTSPPAIVVGLDCITGLQTARILAARDVPVIGLATNPDHFCCRTKVCRDILFADTASLAMIQTLEQLGPTLEEKAVLFPCTDMSVLLISRNRERLQNWYHILLSDADVVEMLMDKVGFTLYAQEAGLPVPTTFLLHNRQQAEEAAGKLTYPCILKPPIKSARWEENATGKVYKAADEAELLALYDTCSAWADVLMVQEWIEGVDADLYSCNCYFSADSKPLVTFIARKIRQWPPETGTSCLGEEVRNDVVLETSLKLFRGVNYRGLGYLEMKRDPRTGKHYIIEPNIGRPTGRSAIAEAGGVELLYTMYCDAIGRPLPDNRQQKYGNARWIYWRRDLQSALYYWRRGDLALGEWRRSWAGKKYAAVFSWTDRGPFIADMWRALGLVTGRRRKRNARSLKVDGQPTV